MRDADAAAIASSERIERCTIAACSNDASGPHRKSDCDSSTAEAARCAVDNNGFASL